jgi:hypothetical protein
MIKKIPDNITSLDKAIAYMEGLRAFDEGLQREDNPYQNINEDLMWAWWNGWDIAYMEAQER